MEIGIFSLVKNGLAIAIDSLQDANGSELPDILDEDEEEAIVDVASQLPALLREAGKLKRALAEHDHFNPKRRKELPAGERRPQLRNDNYLAETIGYTGSFDFKAYLKSTCGPDRFKYPLDHALKCAVIGFDEMAAADVDEAVAEYGRYDESGSVLDLVARALEAGTGKGCFGAVYNILDHDELDSRGTLPWLRHMCNILLRIQFALSWREHKTNAEKKDARDGQFKPGGNLSDDELKSRRYKLWLGRFEAKRTACTKVLDAYETLGSIVVLHAGFDFQVFRDPRTGPPIGDMVKSMSERLDCIPAIEPVHRSLVRRSLRALLKGKEGRDDVLRLFRTVDAAVDRTEIGEL